MKVTGLNGEGVGKIGKEVYSINHGVQIKRKYNPNVSNPSTDAQVGQRSRFKLASQLSAAMQDVIVMPRIGMSSPRNQFVKRNIGFIYGTNTGAIAMYDSFQLTKGSLAFPLVEVFLRSNQQMTLGLRYEATKVADHVVYNIFQKQDDGNLMLRESVVVDDAGQNGHFNKNVDGVEGDIVVYAYGIKLKSTKAKATYSQYNIVRGEDIARLMASKKLSSSDIVLTKTSGTFLAASGSGSSNIPAEHVIVALSSTAPSNVSGIVDGDPDVSVMNPGENIIGIGATVSLTATNANGFEFVGWYINGSQTPISTAATYTFDASENVRVVAIFEYRQGLE